MRFRVCLDGGMELNEMRWYKMDEIILNGMIQECVWLVGMREFHMIIAGIILFYVNLFAKFLCFNKALSQMTRARPKRGHSSQRIYTLSTS